MVDEVFEIGTTMTPTMKVRRTAAKEVYGELIREMYMETDNLMNAWREVNRDKGGQSLILSNSENIIYSDI